MLSRAVSETARFDLCVSKESLGCDLADCHDEL